MNDDDGQATAEDTAFISGSDEEEDSDIIRTKGGWGEDNDIEDTGGGSDRKWLDAYWGKGKGKKKTKTDAQCRNIAAAFKQEMDDSTDTDIEANKKGEPALAKLLMLDALRAQVKKRDLQEKLLEVGLLMSIKRWLEPLPDRSFPNSTLRMGIFEALDEITDPDRGGVAVSPDEVAESGIGRIVMFYKLKDKNPNLKNIAQRLIDRWARPALNIASQGRSGYKEMHDSKTTKGYSKLTVPRVKMVKNEAAPEIIAEKNIQQHLEDRARKVPPSTCHHGSRPRRSGVVGRAGEDRRGWIRVHGALPHGRGAELLEECDAGQEDGRRDRGAREPRQGPGDILEGEARGARAKQDHQQVDDQHAQEENKGARDAAIDANELAPYLQPLSR
jgi:hypothetical protein